jgi:hypothetical protein
MGNASCEVYIADPRGALVPRAWAVQKERMLLSESLVYASLVTRISKRYCQRLLLARLARLWWTSTDPVQSDGPHAWAVEEERMLPSESLLCASLVTRI